jgi:hypothetical protein
LALQKNVKENVFVYSRRAGSVSFSFFVLKQQITSVKTCRVSECILYTVVNWTQRQEVLRIVVGGY